MQGAGARLPHGLRNGMRLAELNQELYQRILPAHAFVQKKKGLLEPTGLREA